MTSPHGKGDNARSKIHQTRIQNHPTAVGPHDFMRGPGAPSRAGDRSGNRAGARDLPGADSQRGNHPIYVVDSLLYFVKNTEELAGTLCHEVSHTIHRDGIALMEKEKKIERREIAAAILLGPTRAHIIAIALIGKLHSLGYSRDAESKADVTGSDICAAAGYNPWGLVWLFQDFQNGDVKQIPHLLSDHPANGTRMNTLEKHFRDNPATFSKFSPDLKSATPLNVPKDAPEQFLRPASKGGP